MELDNRYPPIIDTQHSIQWPKTVNTKRYRVTLADWHKRPDDLIDAACWLYSKSLDDDGLDPWREVDSIDWEAGKTDNPEWFELHPAVGGYESQFNRKYLPTEYVYISQRDYEKLCAHLNGVKAK